MPVQAIKRAGAVVGYQARVGKAGPGQTRYCSTEAQALAALATLPKPAGRTGRTTVTNSTGVPGITARYEGDALRIGATWMQEGKNCAAGYSVERNGLEGAVKMAMAARERGARIKLGMTPRQVLAKLQPHLARIAAEIQKPRPI